MSIATDIGRIATAKQEIKEVVNQDFNKITNETIDQYANKLQETYDEYESYVPWEHAEGQEFILRKGGNGSYLKEFDLKGNMKQSILPEGYTQVDYIESSGTQYIDTGVNADNNLVVNIDTQITTIGNIIGAIYRIENTTTYIRHHLSTSTANFNWYLSGSSRNLGNMDSDRHVFQVDPINGTASKDQEVITTFTPNTFDTTLNFWLFRRNSNDSSLSSYSKMKLYSCQMYYETTMVRNFIPCYRNSDNIIGLYDLINNVFYINQGTGAFTYGAVAPMPNSPVEIDTVTGTQTIKVTGKNKYGITSVESHNYSSSLPTSQNDYMIIDSYDLNNIQFHATNNNYLIVLLPTYQLKPSTDYIITYTRTNNLISGSYARRFIYSVDDNNDYSLINALNGGDNGDMSYQFTTGETGKIAIAFGFNNNSNGSSSTVNNLMIRLATDNNSFEPYYTPQNHSINLGNMELCKIGSYQDLILKSIGKNLFDKNNANILNVSFSEDGKKLNSSNNGKTLWIPCKSNTTYTISKISSTRFRLLTTSETPDVNVVGVDYVYKTTETSATITTSTGIKYLCVYYYLNGTDTLTEQEILDSIQIEEGSTATNYEPYGKVWYKKEYIGKYMYNVSGLTSNGYNENYVSMITPTLNIQANLSGSALSNQCYCSSMPTSLVNNTGLSGTTSLSKIRVNISTSYAADYNSAKAIYQNDNLTIYYVLEKPEYTTITDTTLINQLENILQLETFDNYTAVTAIGDSVNPELEIVLFSNPAYQKWLNNQIINQEEV